MREKQNKFIEFNSAECIGTRYIIKLLEVRHHINRVNTFMLMLRHGQLKLLETVWELLKSAEKRELKNASLHSSSQNLRHDGNALHVDVYYAKEIVRRMLNGPGMYEDACAHHTHSKDQCECNGFDCNRQTAFHHAVRSQQQDVVQWAIVHGGNICWQPPKNLKYKSYSRSLQTSKQSTKEKGTKREIYEQIIKVTDKIRPNKSKDHDHLKHAFPNIDPERLKDYQCAFELVAERSRAAATA